VRWRRIEKVSRGNLPALIVRGMSILGPELNVLADAQRNACVHVSEVVAELRAHDGSAVIAALTEA